LLKGGKGVFSAVEQAANKIHKNSLEYVGETHVYAIKGPDGKIFKIGESAQGKRVRDGASIRAEQQVRRLQKQTGEEYESKVLKTFDTKSEAFEYQKQLIKRYREM
jgi:hypothetical protein